MLESYEPFTVFRDRLLATGSAETAAQHTRSLLDLDAHREEVKDTLIGLGTYSGALTSEGGGKYSVSDGTLTNQFEDAALACGELAAAEARILDELGECSGVVDRTEVIGPLAQALLKARAGEQADAVGDAANAVESYLFRLAARLGVDLTGTQGLSQKVERFRSGDHLPKKLTESARYLAQVRNAADHGVDADPEVSAVWKIQGSTGVLYVFVACSFIRACNAREEDLGYWI